MPVKNIPPPVKNFRDVSIRDAFVSTPPEPSLRDVNKPPEPSRRGSKESEGLLSSMGIELTTKDSWLSGVFV